MRPAAPGATSWLIHSLVAVVACSSTSVNPGTSNGDSGAQGTGGAAGADAAAAAGGAPPSGGGGTANAGGSGGTGAMGTGAAGAAVGGGSGGTGGTGGTGAEAGVVKRVFVTSTEHNGNLGGLAGGDAICNALAGALGGKWVAWLSGGGKSAASRLSAAGPWYLVDGKTLVFASKAALGTSGPTVALTMDEKGATHSAGRAWTGTSQAGQPVAENCGGWVYSAALIGAWGDITSTVAWSKANTQSCGGAARLYCFEE